MLGLWDFVDLEIFTFMAGYVSTTALAAQTILRAISQTCILPVFSLRMSTQIAIGKNIGAYNAKACIHYQLVALKMVAIYALFFASVFTIIAKEVFLMFSRSEEVIAEL